MNLIVFCTTMGHAGKHTYEQTIDNILSEKNKCFDSLITNKIVHLKTRPDEKDVADKIKKYFNQLGFEVIETISDLVHHSENHLNHSAEYCKDVLKVYSIPKVRNTEYSFWLEDDWIIQSKGVDLSEACRESMSFLDNNPDQLCVRFNSAEDFKHCEKDHFHSHGDIYTQGLRYTPWGGTFTFQPNISRTKEIYIAWKSINTQLDVLDRYHCELLSGDTLKHLTDSTTPFSFYDPQKIYAQHIG